MCCEEPELRVRIGCYLAGLLFAIGWWFFIDAAAYARYTGLNIPIDFVKYLPGLGTTLALLLINTMDWEMLFADSSTYHGSNVDCKARTFLFVSICISVASLVGGIVILANDYVDNKYGESIWPGVAIFLQSAFIFFATFIMRLFTASV